MEEWKDISGFEGLYQVSNLGRVKSVAGYKPFSDGRKRYFNEKIRKPVPSDGYLYVVLSKQCMQKRYLVHRLVAEAFVPNPDNKPCVDHINTDTSDCRASNLRWVTHVENQKNPITAKRLTAPSRPVIRKNDDGNTKVYDMLKDVESDGFNIRTICWAIKYGKKHGGYSWNYLTPNINSDCNQKKRVVRISDDGAEHEYASMVEAANDVGGIKAMIKSCCIGKRERYKGYTWRYA